MSTIYTDKVRNYFRDNYRCEVLTSTEENKQLIEKFHAMDKGKSLEAYLKQRAWSEDAEGETRVYFIKDNNDEVPLFFSLKCGLLYKPYDYTRLEDSQQQDFVNMMLDALETHNEQLIEDYISSGFYSYDESKRLLKIAKKQYEVKCEGKRKIWFNTIRMI